MSIFYGTVIASTNSIKQNKTAPGIFVLIGLVLGFVSIIFICRLLSSGAWWVTSVGRLSSGDHRYITVWMLAASAVVLAWLFYHWTGHFHDLLPKPIRAMIALFLSIVAVAIPFFLNQPSTIERAVFAELLLIGFIIVLGISGSIVARRRLEQIRAYGPEDSEILFQVEQVLYRKGQISAEEDFPNLPRDRVKKAFETYLGSNRDKQALDYTDYAFRLSFQRQEDVSKFSDAVEDLKKLLENGAEFQQDIEKASDRLADIVRSQMQCEWGDKFSLPQKAPKEFAVYSLENPELASVLPMPFPLIIYRSNSLINSDELQHLKQLQNELDVPSRFGVLIAIC